jgi:hypothetical protein
VPPSVRGTDAHPATARIEKNAKHKDFSGDVGGNPTSRKNDPMDIDGLLRTLVWPPSRMFWEDRAGVGLPQHYRSFLTATDIAMRTDRWQIEGLVTERHCERGADLRSKLPRSYQSRIATCVPVVLLVMLTWPRWFATICFTRLKPRPAPVLRGVTR